MSVVLLVKWHEIPSIFFEANVRPVFKFLVDCLHIVMNCAVLHFKEICVVVQGSHSSFNELIGLLCFFIGKIIPHHVDNVVQLGRESKFVNAVYVVLDFSVDLGSGVSKLPW